jgi:hypothetical protein
MKNINRFSLALTALFLAALACNLPQSQPPATLDPSLAYTAAAQTVAAQLTQSALTLNAATVTGATSSPTTASTASAPTVPLPATISPTLPPTATQICDKARFVDDITIPDGTILTPGKAFTKTWRIQNIGTCSWTSSYTVVFDHGDQMNGPSTQALVGNVNPGQTVDISINLTAPAANGNYKGYWKLRNAGGVTFTNFYVDIKVQGGAGSGIFAVTSVSFSVGGSCGHFIITANITANRAGTVTYQWIQNDVGKTGPVKSLVFSSAGTQSDTFEWYLSTPGTSWVELYVDAPNHQQFGRANLVCPTGFSPFLN